jgi:hypothetical protein
MSLQSIEDFEKEIAAKRELLRKQHNMLRLLPTTGKTVTWIGEGGWEKDGNTRKPDVERTIDIAPHIIHSKFRDAEHFAYKAPDSVAGETGEHVSSKHRPEFVRKYFLAVLDAYAPFMQDIVALRGTYASYVPDSWDWQKSRDYQDAEEVARGRFEVKATLAKGFTNCELSFYVVLPEIGPAQISFDLMKYGYSSAAFETHKLMAQPHYTSNSERATVDQWSYPAKYDIGAEEMLRRSTDGSSHRPQGMTLEWLFATREDVLAMILPESAK